MTKKSVFVVGGGLGGLIAAWNIARFHVADVTLLEQGSEYALRKIDKDILYGLGGAGTLGGGKLCFPPASNGIWRKTKAQADSYPQFYNELLANLSAKVPHIVQKYEHNKEAIPGVSRKLYDTELLLQGDMAAWISDLISTVKRSGVSIRCNCKLTRIEQFNGEHTVLFENEEGILEYQNASFVILATGRTSVALLRRIFGSKMAVPCPDLGIRLTMQTTAPVFAQAGADIKLKSQIGSYLLRTFCVCSGGEGVPLTLEGGCCYDGHFGTTLSGKINLGILARSSALSGFPVAQNYIRTMQKNSNANLSLRDFLAYNCLLAGNEQYEPLFEMLSIFISRLYNAGILDQCASDIQVMLPSVDHLNPIVYTDSHFESFIPNLFVVGDAAGVSRGFIQAMWSGWCASTQIIKKIGFKSKEVLWITPLIAAAN